MSPWRPREAWRRHHPSIPNSTIHKIAHLNDGQLGNGRSWISRVPGQGSVTITWPEPATIDRVVWGRDRERKFTDRLPIEYSVEAAFEPGKWQIVASSLDRRPYDRKAAPPVEPTAGPTCRAQSPAGRSAGAAIMPGSDDQSLCRHLQPSQGRRIS